MANTTAVRAAPGLTRFARAGRIAERGNLGDRGAARVVACEGWAVTPGLVESHIHLDKALLSERAPSLEGTLAEAIRVVAAGGTYQTPRYAERWQQMRNDPDAFFKILSDREIEVLCHLVNGRNLHEIATALDITYHTARTHQRNVRQKLNVHSTLDLVTLARKYGFI